MSLIRYVVSVCKLCRRHAKTANRPGFLQRTDCSDMRDLQSHRPSTDRCPRKSSIKSFNKYVKPPGSQTKFTRPHCCPLSIDISAARTRPQQQTHRLPLLLLRIDGRDRWTDGRTLDLFMTFTPYYADCVRNKATPALRRISVNYSTSKSAKHSFKHSS